MIRQIVVLTTFSVFCVISIFAQSLEQTIADEEESAKDARREWGRLVEMVRKNGVLCAENVATNIVDQKIKAFLKERTAWSFGETLPMEIAQYKNHGLSMDKFKRFDVCRCFETNGRITCIMLEADISDKYSYEASCIRMRQILSDLAIAWGLPSDYFKDKEELYTCRKSENGAVEPSLFVGVFGFKKHLMGPPSGVGRKTKGHKFIIAIMDCALFVKLNSNCGAARRNVEHKTVDEKSIAKEVENLKMEEEAEDLAKKQNADAKIDEFFGLKFGSRDYRYSRTNYWDKLGLSQPSGSARTVRLPKPEFGFTTGRIHYAGDGFFYEVIAEKTVQPKVAGGKVSEEELIAEQKKVVDEISKKYGIVFSQGDKKWNLEKLWSFYQYDKNFHITVQREDRHTPTIRLFADAGYVHSFPEVVAYRNTHGKKDSSDINCLGRTEAEQKKYDTSFQMESLWGCQFGSTQMCVKTQRLQQPHGIFDTVNFEYNSLGELRKIEAVVMREKYASKHGMGQEAAGEILHREIVKFKNDFEDQYGVVIAGEIGNDLTASKYKSHHYKVSSSRLINDVLISFDEDLYGICFSVINAKWNSDRRSQAKSGARSRLWNRKVR